MVDGVGLRAWGLGLGAWDVGLCNVLGSKYFSYNTYKVSLRVSQDSIILDFRFRFGICDVGFGN